MNQEQWFYGNLSGLRYINYPKPSTRLIRKSLGVACFCIFLIFLNISKATAQNYLPRKEDKKILVKYEAPIQAYAFPLSDVKLSKSIFTHAMEMNAKYLLELEPDRLLHRFHLNAGLTPKGEIYGGWESKGISGHTLGHYLSACAMMYATSGDVEFKKRTDYIVDELVRCQDARKTGYVGGIPDEDKIFNEVATGDIRSQGFDLNGAWVPWYTIHKIFAGLLDVYFYCDNPKAKAVLIKFADWVDTTLKNLDDTAIQKMLACEHGGMNESLVNLYVITGNKKYLDLSYKFHHKAVLDPLSQEKDDLAGKHANTQIPKIIGCARRYEITAQKEDKTIAEFFRDIMVNHRTYVIGGNSNHEHLTKADKLNDQLSEQTAETCNTYNMMKLSGHIFSWNPRAEIFDYYERALYNHILASHNPEDGMVCYFSPLEQGGLKKYSDKFDSFWCCVGSGIENHVKYNESIYFEGKDGSLYVNLFIPSELDWKSKGFKIKQETNYPEEESIHFSIETKKPQAIPIKFRIPVWAKKGLSLEINGKPQKAEIKDSYIIIHRKWKNLDKISLTYPMQLYSETMPDNQERIAFLYGPLVLASALEDSKLQNSGLDVPVLLTDNQNFNEWLKPVVNKILNFETKGVGKPHDIALKPYYKIHGQRVNVYWDYFTQEAWQKRKSDYEVALKHQKELELYTVDVIRIGEMQSERDHNVEGEKTEAGDALGRKYRHAVDGGWFSFDMKVTANKPQQLICTFWGGEQGERVFDILIDGNKIATQTLLNNKPGTFYEEIYNIPQEILKGKNLVKVKFQAYKGKMAGGLYGCRVFIVNE